MTLGTRLEKSVNSCPLGQDSSLDDGGHDPRRDCASCSHVFTPYPGCGLNKSQQVIKCNDTYVHNCSRKNSFNCKSFKEMLLNRQDQELVGTVKAQGMERCHRNPRFPHL